MNSTVYARSPLQGLEILSCNNDRQFAKHLHDGYVLWLNSESGEQYSLNGSTDILQPGTISIIEPSVIHSNRPSVPGQRHLRSFYFSESFLSNLYEQFSGNGSGPPLPTCVINDRLLWREFAHLHEALLHVDDNLSMEIDVVSIFSKLFEEHCGRNVVCSDSADSNRVSTVIDYFHEHLSHQFSLDELSALVQCTSYHLIRLFRREKGITPHAFLIQLRLENARMLLEKGCQITESALLSGFSDQSHLTRNFKARYGVTPGLYMKQRGHR